MDDSVRQAIIDEASSWFTIEDYDTLLVKVGECHVAEQTWFSGIPDDFLDEVREAIAKALDGAFDRIVRENEIKRLENLDPDVTRRLLTGNWTDDPTRRT